MPRRVLGLWSAAGVVLLSWVAVSQPGFLSAPAPVGSPQRLRTSSRPGIVPSSEGAAGSYVLRHGPASALFSERGVRLHLPSLSHPTRELGWSVAGGLAVRPQAEKPREAASLQQEVPAYGGLRYPGVRPGVDLWFEEHAEGVEYGFRAGRGADLRRVELEYAGAREVRVVEEGRALEVELDEGVLREEGLHCAQEGAGGTSYAVACRFTDARPMGRERWAYAIEVDVEEPERPVVVDPVIRWTHYLGGSRNDEFGGMAVTDAGEIFVVGTLDLETGIPTEIMDGLALPTGKGVVLSSYYPDGGFKNWRILHGGSDDYGRAVTIGKDGMVYVAGETTSNAFGLTTYCLNHGTGDPPNMDAFVAQFDPVAFKFLGIFLVGTPEGNELAHGIATAPDGRLFLVGQTTSPAFPGATSVATSDGGVDAFVSKLLPSPSDAGSACAAGLYPVTLEWSIVGRGSHDDVVRAVAVDEAGKVYVAGTTASKNMLPAGSITRPHSGDAGTDDVFVARVDPASGMVEKSIHLGGLGNDEGRALALKGPGSASLFVAGTTRSAGFPLETAPGVSVSDAFVVTLDKDVFELRGASTHGGDGDDEGLALAVDRSPVAAGKNIVYLGGRTTSRNGFPYVDAFDTSFGDGLTEGFVARLEVDAGAPSWSSLVGGGAEDAVLALSNALPGRLLVGGITSSTDLAPVTDGGREPAGENDLFLLQVDLAASTPDAGTNPGDDGGTTNPGDDGGTTPTEDAGTDGGGDGGTPVLRSPLGWSCGASDTSAGPGALSLGTLAGLALLARRRKRADRLG